ncbi:putative membrane protein [Escherichia phage DT57C]|uniref:Putative membrane protein n=2 Tax=Tequintavirus TaxID=187218 RepID=A0A0A7RSR9_9CAUD|nr:Rz-like spanin [Escherichia phage DT57C]YP_009784890.1 Rz-like spanin [Escherichia phage DT571/2]AJA41560.1 putative membrane protein [Escherichia phage DT57C]AJA41691.1 putative membrane protein [Escherichia phage DT571/2]
MIKNFISSLWQGKWFILGAGLAIGIGFGAYHLLNKVETLSGDLAVATKKISTLETSLNNVRAESELRETRMNQYFTMNNVSQADLDKKISQLDKALSRQDIIAAKPGLVTLIAKKQSKEFEERLACLSGSVEYCSQPQSQSQAVQKR